MSRLALIDDRATADIYFEGDIKLTKFDERTKDFTIVMQRKELEIIDDCEIDDLYPNPNWKDEYNDLDWLKTLTSINEVEFDGKSIRPTWKPNQFGQPADYNAFYHVDITDDTITLWTDANGTYEEVFERYNPYLNYWTGERVVLTPDNPYPGDPNFGLKKHENVADKWFE